MAGRTFGSGSNSMANYGTLIEEDISNSDTSFQRLNEFVSNNVMNIKQDTQALGKLERQIGTSSDSSNIRKRIQTIIRTTTHKVTTASQQLGELIKTAKRTGDKRQQLTANSIQQSLNSAVNSFNSAVERVKRSLQEHPEPPAMATPQSGYLDSGELDIHGDRAQLVRAPTQTQQQKLIVSSEASYLEERADRMEELENDITQLHEIMGEIGQMVVTQGEQIDTIERHTENTALNVTHAGKELDKAVRLKRCSRKMKFCLCCFFGSIAFVLIITIIIIIVVTTKH